jgi:hypothetical protein
VVDSQHRQHDSLAQRQINYVTHAAKLNSIEHWHATKSVDL